MLPLVSYCGSSHLVPVPPSWAEPHSVLTPPPRDGGHLSCIPPSCLYYGILGTNLVQCPHTAASLSLGDYHSVGID